MVKNYNEFMKNATTALDAMIASLKDLPTVKLESLNNDKTLLTIVDMNKGFAKAGALYSDRVEALIPEIERLTSKSIDMGMDVIAFSDAHNSKSPELDSYPPHCMKNTLESELVDELAKYNQIELIYKNSTNGLIHIEPRIKARGYDTVIVTGCVTDICVYQFAVALKAYFNEHDIKSRVIIPINAVDTFHIPVIHDAELMNVVFLNSLRANGVELVERVIY